MEKYLSTMQRASAIWIWNQKPSMYPLRFTSRLSIAAPETIWQSTVFSKFRTLIEKYPNISFNVNVLHSNDIVDGILDDNIDIGFVLNRPTHRRIETVELWNCGYVLVKSPALKLNSRHFSPDTLDDFPYIDMDWGWHFRIGSIRIFYPRIYPFHTIHGYLCMNLLLEGLGVCFLPRADRFPPISKAAGLKNTL